MTLKIHSLNYMEVSFENKKELHKSYLIAITHMLHVYNFYMYSFLLNE